MKVYKNKI